jgi:hypothetical protein
MEDLIARVAAHRRGLALLHLGDPEYVATQLGVHPCVVVEAKHHLESPGGREQMIERVRRARESHAAPRKDPPTWRSAPPHPDVLHSARELIRRAENSVEGMAFLTDASPETVAVTFQVHPDLVFRARELLRRWNARKDRN